MVHLYIVYIIPYILMHVYFARLYCCHSRLLALIKAFPNHSKLPCYTLRYIHGHFCVGQYDYMYLYEYMHIHYVHVHTYMYIVHVGMD